MMLSTTNSAQQRTVTSARRSWALTSATVFAIMIMSRASSAGQPTRRALSACDEHARSPSFSTTSGVTTRTGTQGLPRAGHPRYRARDGEVSDPLPRQVHHLQGQFPVPWIKSGNPGEEPRKERPGLLRRPPKDVSRGEGIRSAAGGTQGHIPVRIHG